MCLLRIQNASTTYRMSSIGAFQGELINAFLYPAIHCAAAQNYSVGKRRAVGRNGSQIVELQP